MSTTFHNLTLTGDTTASSRFIVLFGEQSVALPASRFFGLLVLIDAKGRRPNGRAELVEFSAAGVAYDKAALHSMVRRLRGDLDDALGTGSGNQLIVHNGRSRYSLAIDPAAIRVEPDFRELERDIPVLLFQRLEQLIADPWLGSPNAASASSVGSA